MYLHVYRPRSSARRIQALVKDHGSVARYPVACPYCGMGARREPGYLDSTPLPTAGALSSGSLVPVTATNSTVSSSNVERTGSRLQPAHLDQPRLGAAPTVTRFPPSFSAATRESIRQVGPRGTRRHCSRGYLHPVAALEPLFAREPADWTPPLLVYPASIRGRAPSPSPPSRRRPEAAMFRWLVNAGFLALPIAATLGILLGIQSHRQATGQAPLFTPPLNNKWVEKTYCQKAFGIHPDTKGQEFTRKSRRIPSTFWGLDEGEAGFLCMNVTTFNNQTYATRTTAPSFSAVWQYNPKEKPVHAFPNIKVDGDVLPAPLEKIKHYNVDVKWSMRLDNDTEKGTSTNELKKGPVNANVAIDMFIDKDKSKASNSTAASHEVMVWLAAIGPASHTIGQDKGPVKTMVLDGTFFDLFIGPNPGIKDFTQQVLTWKARELTPTFKGDISELVNDVVKSNDPLYPSPSDYLGYFAFGTEAYDSPKPVTFSVPSLSIDIQKS
ncbi:hypothetical protein HIM_09372 [Hirsutella minnesotensis 3608]|uniref:Uncharacterized protein n=1 Tax=Hirsutella minnesotensis 3608 TaxID=1043627 RepID=A0A0F8A353_9HYPO|nr:hypothetical protein HIM_09372 [Hirsutella minnesotensis 3608]